MTLVTGATGTIGSRVVQLLREREVPFEAMSRNPVDLPNAVRAELTDPASLEAAASGVDAVFLVTVPPTPSPAHDLALTGGHTSGRRVQDRQTVGDRQRRAVRRHRRRRVAPGR